MIAAVGESLHYQKGNLPKKFINGHYKPKPVSDETRRKYSESAKRQLANLSPDEMKERMNKSALSWKNNPERGVLRGKRISESKKGKCIRVSQLT